jgi:hypothetical protein
MERVEIPRTNQRKPFRPNYLDSISNQGATLETPVYQLTTGIKNFQLATVALLPKRVASNMVLR